MVGGSINAEREERVETILKIMTDRRTPAEALIKDILAIATGTATSTGETTADVVEYMRTVTERMEKRSYNWVHTWKEKSNN